MTPKTARNLSAVAFVALVLPGRNLLTWVDILFHHFGALSPVEKLRGAASSVFGLAPIWLHLLLIVLVAFLASLALYRYLRRRDFPQICADCAARKPLVWTLFLLFAFLSLLHPFVHKVPATMMPPPDDPANFDENFEVSPDDAFADAEDAPPPTPTPPPLP